jgi:hypothetical protein
MAVYTDGMHLVADTEAELHTFAQSMGLRRTWYQDHATHPHYDLTTGNAYRRALELGAVIVTAREILRLCEKVKMAHRI